jgi:hypothetical protein
MTETGVIRTPDQRVRVFVSSSLQELAPERHAVRDAVARLRLVPVTFELGAQPYPARQVYRDYLAQSHVFVGVYWQSYGSVAFGEEMSGLEDEYRLSATLPRLIYVKSLAPQREPRLAVLAAAPVPGDHGADRSQGLGGDHVPGRAEAAGSADLGQQPGDVPFGPPGGLAHRFGGDAAERRDAGRQGGPAGQYPVADHGQGLGVERAGRGPPGGTGSFPGYLATWRMAGDGDGATRRLLPSGGRAAATRAVATSGTYLQFIVDLA